MALKNDVTTNAGVQVKNAYNRVENIILAKKDMIEFLVKSYVTSENLSFYDQFYASSYDLNGENPIKQAYEYLKTLPEFADAKDC